MKYLTGFLASGITATYLTYTYDSDNIGTVMLSGVSAGLGAVAGEALANKLFTLCDPDMNIGVCYEAVFTGITSGIAGGFGLIICQNVINGL